MRLVQMVARLDVRYRLMIGFVAAGAVFLSLRGHARLSTEFIAAWDALAFSVLLLAWFTILTTPTHTLRARAKEQDVSRLLASVFIICAACAALFAVGFLIRLNKNQMHSHFTVHLILGLLTVILAWSITPTVFSFALCPRFLWRP